VRCLSHALFVLRRFGIALRSWRPRWLVDILLRRPNRVISQARAPSPPPPPGPLVIGPLLINALPTMEGLWGIAQVMVCVWGGGALRN